MTPVAVTWPIRVGNTEIGTFPISDPETGDPLDLTTYTARLSITWPGATSGGIYWRTGTDPELVMLDQTDPLTRGLVQATISPALSRTLPDDRAVTGELELRGSGDGTEDSLLDITLDISRGSNRDG
jgi:hypothetical protein